MLAPFQIERLCIGLLQDTPNSKGKPFYVDVTMKPEGELSICGECYGCSGQVIMSFKEFDYRGHWTLDSFHYQNEEHKHAIATLFKLWDQWHLNHMRAGSPAQEEFLNENPPTNYAESDYTYRCKLLEQVDLQPDVNYLYNGKPYSYGSAWLKEEMPPTTYDLLKQTLQTLQELKIG